MPSVRSCRVPVREGLVARGEHACPRSSATCCRWSGWCRAGSRRPSTTTASCDRAGCASAISTCCGSADAVGCGRGAGRRLAPGGSRRRIDTDVLVVGGGRAGLARRAGAAEAGARVAVDRGGAAIGAGWQRVAAAPVPADDRHARRAGRGGRGGGRRDPDRRRGRSAGTTGWSPRSPRCPSRDPGRRDRGGDRLVRARPARTGCGPAGGHGGADRHRPGGPVRDPAGRSGPAGRGRAGDSRARRVAAACRCDRACRTDPGAMRSSRSAAASA